MLLAAPSGMARPTSFRYLKQTFETGGMPYVAEVAFAYAPNLANRIVMHRCGCERNRQLVVTVPGQGCRQGWLDRSRQPQR
jgi:hypothetical protein